MAANILEVTDLEKYYAKNTSTEVHALRGVDLTIKKGEMIAIMGPSGCGKSTLLNMIGGLDKFNIRVASSNFIHIMIDTAHQNSSEQKIGEYDYPLVAKFCGMFQGGFHQWECNA